VEIGKLRDKGSRMKQFCIGMVVACLALLATQASAQISSVEGPVPTGPDSSIFIAADVPGARLSIPLTPYGYVEEEYFIKGTAAAYGHSPSGQNVLRAKFPYTTRIIVRRPADPKRFSGVVHFEPIHPTQGYVGHWLVLDRYLMSRGDIYVAAGVGDADKGWSGSPHNSKESAPVGSHSVTKWFETQRYSALQWPEEEGIRYEVTHAEGSRAVRAIRVSFGDGHQLEISQNGKKTTIRFVGRQRDLVLDASDKGCEFERAVNLMRLYMGK